jgi:hypothetical protein
MRKLFSMAFVAVLACSLVASQPALAKDSGGVTTHLPPAGDFGFAAGEVCPFSVRIHPLKEDLYVTEYSPTFHKYFGTYVVQVINLDSVPARSVRFDNSNTIWIKEHPDKSQTLWATPTGLFYFFAGDARHGLLKTSGFVVETIGPPPDFTVTSFWTDGKVEDLCKTLLHGGQQGDGRGNGGGS